MNYKKAAIILGAYGILAQPFTGNLPAMAAKKAVQKSQQITTKQNLRDQVQAILDEINQSASATSEPIFTRRLEGFTGYEKFLETYSESINQAGTQSPNTLEGTYRDLEAKTSQKIIERLTPLLPSSFVVVDLFRLERCCSVYVASRSDAPRMYWNFHAHIRVRVQAKITEKGEKILRAGAILGSLDGAGVVDSVYGIGHALSNLELGPSQKRQLNGFWEAAKRFATALKAEEEKMLKGEKYKKDTHNDFREYSILLVSYYHYLDEVLKETAQLGSESRGVNENNIRMVEAIQKAVNNLIDSYGLEGEAPSRHVASYSRVLSDLIMNQLEPIMTPSERDKLSKPIKLSLGEVLTRAAGESDIRALDAVKMFKQEWENRGFQDFMKAKATTNENGINVLIMNMNSLARKIGNKVGIRIEVLTPDDIDSVRVSPPSRK